MHTPETHQALTIANMERLEAREARMVWGACLANGALLIALVGAIGNVPQPNEALIFLRWPLLWLALGVGFGGGGGYAYTMLARLFTRYGGAELYVSTAQRFLDEKRFPDAFNAYATAVALVKNDPNYGLNFRVNEKDPEGTANTLRADYQTSQLENYRRSAMFRAVLDATFWASLTCLGISVATVVGCIAQGYRLQA